MSGLQRQPTTKQSDVLQAQSFERKHLTKAGSLNSSLPQEDSIRRAGSLIVSGERSINNSQKSILQSQRDSATISQSQYSDEPYQS